MREKLFRFFSGRNGPDALGQATSFVCVALILLNLFVGSYVLYALELLLMAVWIFRLFSRNTARRRAENARYLKLRDRVRGAFRRLKAALFRAENTRLQNLPALPRDAAPSARQGRTHHALSALR